MTKTKVYLAWANSVLSETGRRLEGVTDLQDGRALCELVDILAPDAALLEKLQACGVTTQWSYIQTVLDHMKNHGIKFSFTVQDIIDGDIKALLDVLWLLILNYSIHYIGQNAYQRSVGIGKKHLLEWCQQELGTTFDPRNTLAFNLCTGQWFVALLKKYAGTKVEDEDSVALLTKLMEVSEEKYGISRSILSPSDILDGTVDEHTLMIYIALLRRRIGGDAMSQSRVSLSAERLQPDSREASPLSRDASPLSRDSSLDSSPDNVKCSSDGELYGRSDQPHRRRYHRVLLSEGRGFHMSRSPRKEKSRPPRLAMRQGNGMGTNASSGDTSDWASSSTGSLFGSENVSPAVQAESPDPQSESVLLETISQQVESMLLSGSASSDKEGETTAGEESATPKARMLDIPPSPRRSDIPPSPRTSSPRKRDATSPRKSEGASPRMRDIPQSPRRLEAGPSPLQSLSTTSSDQLKLELPSMIQKSPRSDLEESLDFQQQQQQLQEDLKSSEDTDSIMDGSRLDSLLDGALLDSISSSGQREGFGADEDTRRPEVGRPRSQSDIVVGTSHPLPRRPPESGSRSHFRIKRPTDYFHQWEDALDRLSQGPVADSSTSDWSRNLSPRPSRPNSIPRESPRDPPDSGRRHRSLDSGDFDRRRTPTPDRSAEVTAADEEASSMREQQSRKERRMERRQMLQELSSAMSDPDALLSSTGLSRSLFDELGDNVDVLLLSEAIRRARLEVKESMPDDSAPRRREDDSDETIPLKVVDKDSSDHEGGSSDGRKKKDRRARERDMRARERERRDRERQERERETREEEELRRQNELSFRMETKDYVSPRRPYDTLTPAQIRERLNASRVGGRSTPSPTSRSHLTSPAGSVDRSSPQHMATPEPVSRSSSSGHVPRREAWEQARRRKEEADIVLDASKMDSIAQAKFIEVLTREIEELRYKVDVLERPKSAEAPRESGTQATGQTWDAQQRAERCNPYNIDNEVHDEGNQMVFETSRSRSASRSRSMSPRRQVTITETSPGRSSHRSPVAADSPRRTPTRSPEQLSSSRRVGTSPSREDRAREAGRHSPARRTSPMAARRRPSPHGSPDRLSQSTGALERGWRYSSLFDPNDLTLPISLGYSSPIRSVSQEIWGHDLDVNSALDLQRKAGWKRLITRRDLSEEDIIELKQSLASAIVENDILHAKLTNGKREIGEKLMKTNEVLDDCRKHLAKSQAENMDLRTMLEQEKQRGEVLEGRVQEAENKLFQAVTSQQELERELEETLTLLDKAITENKPGIEALRLENQRLRARLNIHYTDNTALRQQLESMSRCYEKSQGTVNDLRSCLDEVRKERSALFEEVSSNLEKEQAAKVASIMSRYSSDSGISSDSSSSPARHRSSSMPSPTRLDQRSSTPKPSLVSPSFSPTRRSPTRRSPIRSPIRSPARSPARSPIRSASRSPARKSPRRYAFTTEDISPPVVPSSFREIYPHRKARYYNQGRGRSLTRCQDYPDLQLYPEKLGSSQPDYLSNPYVSLGSSKSPRDRSGGDRQAALTRRRLPLGGTQDQLNNSVSDFRPSYLRPRPCSPSPDPIDSLLDEPDLLPYASTSRRSMLRGRSPSPYSSPERLSLSFRSASGRQSPYCSPAKEITRSRSVSPGPNRFRSHSPPTRLDSTPLRPTPRRCTPPRVSTIQDHTETTGGEKKFSKFSKPRSMSWYEYQLKEEEKDEKEGNVDDKVAEILGKQDSQPPVTLTEAQRRYADHLIAKYTNQHINVLTT